LHQGIVLNFSRASQSDKCGLIGLRVETDRLVLIYRNRQNGGQWEQIKDEIFFTLCPGCNQRVAIIYGGKYYRCRHCHNLTYSSQQESESDRLMRKARKIRSQLGASKNLSVPILFKPKNIHQKTFDRLRKTADDASNRSIIIMGKRLGINV
jgi:hypothetical protein